MNDQHSHTHSHHKEKSLLNFKKAHSHIAKIIKMIEEDKYCIDIMQQNLAVIGLLKSAHETLMEGHLQSCFKQAVVSQDSTKQAEMTEEILKVTKMYNK
ncbi:MAG: Copper-sensing transcriptional repressor CsoR [bacterium ADurb.Bin400]|nr:MAG: Copper-sensing transcriptional repressor CsoR [bacterium ADurb.Bin400]